MKKRALVIVCLALLVTPGFARADAPPSLAEYRRAVEDVILLVERAENEPSGSARQSFLNQAADLLGSISHVQLGQGAPVPADNSALIQELKSQPSELMRVHTRLVALRDSLADPPVSPGEADRARLKDLLSRPPFSAAQGPDLLGQLLQAILDFLARLALPPIRGTLEPNDWITLVGLGLFAVLVGALIWHLRRNLVADETASRAEAVSGRLTSREAVRHAYEFVNDGNYREAVRQLYLAALLLLDERGQLYFDSSRTDHEYLLSVLANRALYDSLGPIIETFEDTWYGMEPITPQEFEAYRRRVEAVGIA